MRVISAPLRLFFKPVFSLRFRRVSMRSDGGEGFQPSVFTSGLLRSGLTPQKNPTPPIPKPGAVWSPPPRIDGFRPPQADSSSSSTPSLASQSLTAIPSFSRAKVDPSLCSPTSESSCKRKSKGGMYGKDLTGKP